MNEKLQIHEKSVKKGAIGVVEELTKQGYSIKESLEVLAEANRKIEKIRRFVNGQAEETLLEDASRRNEEFIEGIYKSVKGL